MSREGYIPKADRKTMLFLSDDMRVPSGIGNMTKEIIEGTCHKYNWVQLGAAITHPDFGKIIDMSQNISERTGVEDVSVLVYPYNGYGDPIILRRLMDEHNPSAIIHFTDPRYWVWLYQMEHEIRQKIPIFFYTIWDDLPYPYYNEDFYRSCDWLACISKQTYNIVKQVRNRNEPLEPWQLTYIPHGVDPDKIYKMDKDDPKLVEFRKKYFGDKEFDFVVTYNSRNIRRKMTSDIMLAFDMFNKMLPEDKRDKTALLLHTQAVEEAGTNLLAVHADVVPDINLFITNDRLDEDGIRALYNLGDVTVNVSSNEGFGLSVAESLMAETPVVVNVTGGLQDQCGFVDEEGNPLDPDTHYTYEWGSNHDGRYKEHGEWVIPVWPHTRTLVGSPVTPYIFDDRCKWEDVADAFKEWYDMTPEERERRGKAGRDWCIGDGGLNVKNMCNLFMEHMEIAMDSFKPRDRFVMEVV